MTSRTRLLVGAALCVGLLASAPAGADDDPRARGRTFFLIRVTEALDLPEEKALHIGRILRETDRRRSELEDRVGEVIGELRDAEATGDLGAMESAIAEFREISRELGALPEQGFARVTELLSVEEQAGYVLVFAEIQREVRTRAARRRLED